MVVEDRGHDTGARRDVLHLRRGEAALGEHFHRRVEDADPSLLRPISASLPYRILIRYAAMTLPNRNSVDGSVHGGRSDKQRIQWLAVHGVVRGISKVFSPVSGDPQGRLIADPAVRANPVAFIDELRATGPIVKCRAVYMTVDHKIANDLLRSDDFHVFAMGSNLPKPLQWVADRTETRPAASAPAAVDVVGRTARPHPLPQAGVVGVHHHVRLPRCAIGCRTPRTRFSTNSPTMRAPVDVVERYCSQLPVTVIGDILGVPDDARPRILRVRRAGRAQPRHRPDVAAVPAGLSRHRGLQRLAVRPPARSCAAIPATT